MKKFIAIILAALCVFALCACGNDGGSGNSGNYAHGGPVLRLFRVGSALRAVRIIFFLLFAADGDDKRSRNSRRERKQPPKLKRSHNSDGNERHRRHALKNAEKRSALLRRTDGKARVQRARQRKIQKNETDNESVWIHITIKPSDRGRSRSRPYLISFSAPRWRG